MTKNSLGYEIKYTTKEDALKAITNYKYSIEYASDELLEDKNFILEVVKIDGWFLKYASDELRADRNFLLECVKQNSHILEPLADSRKQPII